LLCVLMYAIPLTAGEPSYPERPIRYIIAMAPGGGQDTIARAMSQKLGQKLGTNIIIENRPGGSGNIGVDIASKAAPDGYTLLMVSSTNIIYPLISGIGHDISHDFEAVSHLADQPYLVVTTPSLPVKSLADLISYAKSNPGKLNFASAGQGSLTHLAGEMLKLAAGIDMVHVPFKGLGDAYASLMGGHVQLAFATIVSALPHVRANRLRGLAVSSPIRTDSIPDMPTIAESGYPGFSVTQWYGILAPKGTPRRIIDKLSGVFATVIRDPDVAARVRGDGGEPVGKSAQQFESHLKTEREKFSRVVSKTGIRIE
jgi:tripartite-type tricarboxylate transporter receptor subunit TctC